MMERCDTEGAHGGQQHTISGKKAPNIYIYGTVSSKITLLGSFSSFEIFSFSLNSKELLSNGPYTSKIGLSIIKL